MSYDLIFILIFSMYHEASGLLFWFLFRYSLHNFWTAIGSYNQCTHRVRVIQFAWLDAWWPSLGSIHAHTHAVCSCRQHVIAVPCCVTAHTVLYCIRSANYYFFFLLRFSVKLLVSLALDYHLKAIKNMHTHTITPSVFFSFAVALSNLYRL